jgi:Tfp pilus assembly protein PilV
MRKTRRRHRKEGFTLTEVVVASLLLVIAIVPILKALTSAHVSTAIIERRTHSLILAQAKLDEIKARSIYHYDESFAAVNLPLGDSYLVHVEDVPAGADLREITVSVGQDLNDSRTLQEDEIEVTLSTYLARRW